MVAGNCLRQYSVEDQTAGPSARCCGCQLAVRLLWACHFVAEASSTSFNLHRRLSHLLYQLVIKSDRVEASPWMNNFQLCNQASPRPSPPQRHPHRATGRSHPGPTTPQSHLSNPSLDNVQCSLVDSPTCCPALVAPALNPTARNSVPARSHRTTSTAVLARFRCGRWT